MRAAGFSPSAPADSWEGDKAAQALSFQEVALLKAVLAAGLYDNVGRIICAKSVDATERLACVVETAQGKAQVHPSSVNRALQTHGWLLYQEKVQLPFLPTAPGRVLEPVLTQRVGHLALQSSGSFCSHWWSGRTWSLGGRWALLIDERKGSAVTVTAPCT